MLVRHLLFILRFINTLPILASDSTGIKPAVSASWGEPVLFLLLSGVKDSALGTFSASDWF